MSGDDDYEYKYEDVENLMDSDLSDFDDELGKLYDEMERYTKLVDALFSAGRDDDARYFMDLAVDRYESFSMAIQLEKEIDDDEGIDYEQGS